jgi:Lon protease-like protein
MTDLPMFPLGSVLFPHMPLRLRVFEERYLVMLARILEEEPAEFGTVLIERGQEVGGGEQRFPFGTVARILQLDAPEGFVGLVAQGSHRIEVVEWLEEDPYPRAVVRELPALEWDEGLRDLKTKAELAVRRTLAVATEFADDVWPPDVELSDDPVESAWQLAAIVPVGALDQVAMLRSTTMAALLDAVIAFSAEASESFRASWPDAGDDTDSED